MNCGKSRYLAAIAFVSFLMAGNAYAQQLTAQIKGTVTDASGASIPGAIVKATNTQTGVSTTITSQDDGSFQFLQLAVGHYDVVITKPGFETFMLNGVLLELNQIFNVPATLQVGAVNQSVEVQAAAAQVENASTQVDTVIQGQQIVDTPLNGRNWTQLQQLVPGVVASSDRFSSNYATNGSESQQNSYLINGADSIDLPLNTPLIIPSPDAIAEFNLIDSTINPEYGRNSGGILNAIIKSGTNSFHGDAFEFYRDTFLNGRNLFQQSPPVFHQNQFGGTLGGPVWKNHTFFFLSYQGTRNREPESGVSDQTTVFTQAQRSGLFSDIIGSTGSSPVPLTGADGHVYPAGTSYSQLFPTGQIPTVDLNPIAVKLMNSYVPLPNSPGGLYSFNAITTSTVDQGIARIDHTFSDKDSAWATLFFQHEPTSDTLPFDGASLPGFGDESTEASKEFTADWTHTFNSTTVNEARLSYVRLNFVSVQPQKVVQPSSLGFDINPQDPAGAGVPVLALDGYFTLGFSYNGPQPRVDETYEAADNFSKVVGKHTFKVGFDGKRYNVDNPFNFVNNGYYSFGPPLPYSTGDAGADFLLGIPDFYEQTSGGWQVGRTYEYYGYFQDSWKIRENLTFNYGTGYQIDTPLNNQHFNGLDNNCFVPGQQSTIFPTAPTGLLFPGDKGCTQSGYHNHYDHFGPRAGFAWSPGSSNQKKFVIRGGFGVYFNRTEEELLLQSLQAVPFSQTSFGIGDVGGYPSLANPYQDIATGQTIPNKFPFTAPVAGATNVNFSQFQPMTLTTMNPNLTSPYAMNYNLNVQQSLPGAMILQVGYVASLGRHLETTLEANPITPAGAAACASNVGIYAGCFANRTEEQVLYPSLTEYAPGNIFQSVGQIATVGVSSYNSLQVSLNKHSTHGLTLLLAYTWSHAIDDTSGFENSFGSRGEDPFNLAVDKGDSAYDARQRFVATYDYEIPHVSRFWSNAFSRAVLDGWHIAGITTLQSGFPVNVTDSYDTSLQCNGNNKFGCWDGPDLASYPATYNARNSVLTNTTSPASLGTPLPYYYFDPNAFTLPAIGSIGNAGRNNIHGPGINNTDIMLSKRVYFGVEQQARFVELRLEGYNVFNHTQFLGTSLTSDFNNPNFGRVTDAAIGRTVQLAAKIYF